LKVATEKEETYWKAFLISSENYDSWTSGSNVLKNKSLCTLCSYSVALNVTRSSDVPANFLHFLYIYHFDFYFWSILNF
jgi:hypothetical protein